MQQYVPCCVSHDSYLQNFPLISVLYEGANQVSYEGFSWNYQSVFRPYKTIYLLNLKSFAKVQYIICILVLHQRNLYLKISVLSGKSKETVIQTMRYSSDISKLKHRFMDIFLCYNRFYSL